jgi:uncharacterized membrane protein YqiK
LIGDLVALVALALLAFVVLGIRFIPNDRVGIVEKRFSGRGSLRGGFIALAGEAGYQPAVLRGGLHWLTPFQFSVHRVQLVTITQGKLGYVFARDGQPLAPEQALAANTDANDFTDVRSFLVAGGQRGPQRKVLREGTYAINLAQFIVITQEKVYHLPLDKEDRALFDRMSHVLGERMGFTPLVISGLEDVVGIVTTHDGPAMAQGEIIAPVVGDDPADPATFHNSFQDPEKFLAAGGRRGRQLQVLVEGTYYLNRLFATVERIPKTIIEVGSVGVVVSYTGATGTDLSGKEYKHGELVETGQRGVWIDPLLPGKYAFNLYAGNVVAVPTTNFILKWNKSESGAHRFDENLAEVNLITKDAFEPLLPLSVVVHIDYRKAPLVIQRFGDIKRLVEQTLDPMVAAYFKNVGQTRTLIQLIHERSHIQEQSSAEMRSKFEHYNLELEEVLIGTPGSAPGDQHIEVILTQLRERQIAEEQVATYALKEKAAIKERELNEAQARAAQQQNLTESEIGIAVRANQGKAETQAVMQQAAQIRAIAEAEADKIRLMAEADAERAARVGIAEALAIEEQVRASGGPRYQMTRQVVQRFAEAIETSKVDVVPRIVMGGNGTSTMSGAIEALLALTLSDRMGEGAATAAATPMSAEAEAMRQQLRGKLKGPPSAPR